MTKLQAIAKMFFLVIGVNAFVFAVGSFRGVGGAADWNAWLLYFLFSCFFYVLIAYFLIFKSDKLAVKLGKNSEDATEQWVVMLFVGAGIFTGGLLLAGVIKESYILRDLFKAISVLPSEISRWVSVNEMPSLLNINSRKKMQIVAWFIKAGAALYLLFGMKLFVRWQVSKLKKLNLAVEAD